MVRPRVAELIEAWNVGRKAAPPWAIPVILTIYLLVGTALAFHYRYGISPDGTAYIDIAHEYASGR